jgi:hypothetical protein
MATRPLAAALLCLTITLESVATDQPVKTPVTRAYGGPVKYS